jgi:hypothetical protein
MPWHDGLSWWGLNTSIQVLFQCWDNFQRAQQIIWTGFMEWPLILYRVLPHCWKPINGNRHHFFNMMMYHPIYTIVTILLNVQFPDAQAGWRGKPRPDSCILYATRSFIFLAMLCQGQPVDMLTKNMCTGWKHLPWSNKKCSAKCWKLLSLVWKHKSK